jgi:hypothetical protein
VTYTAKTRAQLIERAGINLGLVQPGEALSSEDYNTLDNLVDPLVDQLSADSVIYLQDAGISGDQSSGSIEAESFLALAALLANFAGPSFGSPINDDALTRDKGLLKRISATKPTYAPLRVDYF